MRSISLKDCRRHFTNILAGHADKVNCTFAPCCQEMEEMCDNEKDQPEDRHTFFNCTCLLYPCQVESHSTEASRAEAQTLAQRLCCVLAPVTVKIFKSQQNLLASFCKCHVLMFCQKLYPGHLLKLVLKAC